MLRHFLALLSLTALTTSADWPNWRGPTWNGTSEETNLPTDLGTETAVKWKTPLPGPGAGTPVIVGDSVFVSAADGAKGELLAICINRTSGAVRWQQNASSGYRPGDAGTATSLDDKSNYASPSASSDGKRVVFFFGNGDLATYAMDGTLLWQKNLQKTYGDFTFQWTFSSSPTLLDDRIYIQILQRNQAVHGRGREGNESFLVALAADTGAEIWKQVRPSTAKMESLESYATPIPFSYNGRSELLVVGGDVLTGHDPASGKELWRWGTWNVGNREQWWRVVPSPVAGNGAIVVCGPKGAPACAVKAGLTGTHEDQDGLLWAASGNKTPISSDVPTPCFYRDRFFLVSDVRKSMSRVNPSTGAIDWTVELPGSWKWRSSPTGADGRIWLLNHNGELHVFSADDGKLLTKVAYGTPNDDNIRASVSISNGNVFLRTNQHLICLGK